MRKSPISSAVAEEEDINLTPMLDVVFILLIFFIVTANFIKEPGLEVNRPDAETSNIQPPSTSPDSYLLTTTVLQ